MNLNKYFGAGNASATNNNMNNMEAAYNPTNIPDNQGYQGYVSQPMSQQYQRPAVEPAHPQQMRPAAAQPQQYQQPQMTQQQQVYQPQSDHQPDPQSAPQGPDMDKAIRIDGKNSFVELSLGGLNLMKKNAEGMLILSFVSYDENNHRTAYLQNYLRFGEWYKLYAYIVLQKGEFVADCVNNIQTAAQQQGGGRYVQPKSVHTVYRGGTNRATGQLESRIFEVRPGNNARVFGLCSSVAPGKRTQTGAVMPCAAPTSRVNLFIGYDDLAALLETGMQEIQAFKTALALKRVGVGGAAPSASGAFVASESTSDQLSSLKNELMDIKKSINHIRDFVE